MIRLRLLALLSVALLLAACGPTKHVFPPGLSIQQLRVGADGQWTVTVRMNNYSYDSAVRFDHLHATFKLGDDDAGTLDAAVAIDVAERSADVTDVRLTPSSAAQKALAALGDDGSRNIAYSLKGTVQVTPEDKSQRDFPVDHHDWLSPVPGVPGTYR
jgi:hypothetical protein